MRRNATIGSLLSVAALSLGATACGGEDAVESIFENAVENETGGEVDLDFGGDGFSIDTGEGSMTMDEDGNMVIVGPDGEVITGQVDPETGSMTMESEDGSFSLDADEDGSMTMEGDDGSFSLDAGDDDTSSLTIETDEGAMTIDQVEGIPDEWPDGIPRPEGLTAEPGQVMAAPGEGTIISVQGDAADGAAWVESYVAALEAAGFTETVRLESPDGIQGGYERDGEFISLLASESGAGGWGVFISLTVEGE